MLVKNQVDALTTAGNLLPSLRATLEDFARQINAQGIRIAELEAAVLRVEAVDGSEIETSVVVDIAPQETESEGVE
jgi:hypothetical protein